METLIFVVGIIFAFAYAIDRRAKAQRVQRVQQAYRFNPANTHGGARFADNDALNRAGLFKGKGVPIGYSPDGKHALHYPGHGHILTVAAARTGKGATLLVNALLSWRRSALVIDPKAENAAISGHRRKKFGKVFVVNPFGMLADALKGLPSARINPMDILEIGSAAFHALCDKLAAALVWDEGKEGMHFTTAARVLVSGVIAALKRHGTPLEQTLPMVLRVISGNIFGFCSLTVQSTNDAYIMQKLARFAAPGAEKSKEVMDVISTAITQLSFMGNQAIAESLSGSDFRFSDMKRAVITIYICLPLNMLDICDKYFRLLLEVFMTDILNAGPKGNSKRILAVVDEMAQLGPHMKSLENAMGMAAGAAGLQLWCVLQDLSQLKGMFPQTWETFIQNCGVTTWFGARDHTTRTYVSQLAGTAEVVNRSRSISVDHMTGEPHINDSLNPFGRPLLLPDEVGQLAPDEMIAFVEGVRCGPVKAKRKFYFDVFSRWQYSDNPYQAKSSFIKWLFE